MYKSVFIKLKTFKLFLNFERYRNVTCMQHELGLPSIAVCGEIPMELGSVFKQHHFVLW